MKVSQKQWIERQTGVSINTRCFRCGITALESFNKGPVETGINHPEYCQTYSFYRYSGEYTNSTAKHACPRCHRELELKKTMIAIDVYEDRMKNELRRKLPTQ